MTRSRLKKKKDGNWYIYPCSLAQENLNNAHRNIGRALKVSSFKKSFQVFKFQVKSFLGQNNIRQKTTPLPRIIDELALNPINLNCP